MLDITLTAKYLVNLIAGICLVNSTPIEDKSIKCFNYYLNCTIKQERDVLIMKDTPNCVKLKKRLENK